MDYFLSVILRRSLCLFVLFFFSFLAHATIPAQTKTTTLYKLAAGWGDAAAICKEYVLSTYGAGVNTSVSDGYCNVLSSTGSVWRNHLMSKKTEESTSCPDNSMPNPDHPTECSCQSGYKESSDKRSCVKDEKCASHKGGSDLFSGAALVLPGKPYCPTNGSGASCGAVVTGAWSTDNKKSWTVEVKYTGESCTPSPGTSTMPNEAPQPCKGYPGQVNGVDVCIPFSPSNPPTDVVAPPSDDATSETGPDGSKVERSTSSQTSCSGDKCTTTTTTTTTTTPTSGPPVTTTSESRRETDKKTFCDENPNASVCKVGKWSGDCDAPPACDGDAITCAIAAQTLKTACALSPKDDGERKAFDDAKLTPAQVQEMVSGGAVNIGPASFATGNLLSGSCIQDRTVSVLGKSVSIPLSGVCPYLEMLGNALLAFSFVAAAVIVFRG